MAARSVAGCSHPGCGQLIGVSEAAGAGLKRCTKCRQKVYCSKECQVRGWKGGHKQECERLREGGEAGGGSGDSEAVLQEAVRAALLGITRRALTERQVRGGGASAGGGFTTAGATALMVALTETASAQGGQAGLEALAQRMMTGLLGTNGRAPTHRQMRVLSEMMGAFHARKYEEVVRMEEEGLAVAGEIRGARAGPSIAAAIYCMLGDSFVARYEHVKGLGLLEQARALAVESGEIAAQGEVCNCLGNFHRVQGEFEKAIEEIEQARAIAVEMGKPEGEGKACNILGLNYRALMQYDKAIELFEHSLRIYEELGDKRGQENTRSNLGRCLSCHGQHGRAVACLKQAWAFFEEHGDEDDQVRAAKFLGQVLWARARAEHHQAAPDASSSGGVSAAGADTLQEAETWLRTALDMANTQGWLSLRMETQMHLACVAMMKGDEDEAVELLTQHLQGWVVELGPCCCAGCLQVRGEDTPMLSCDGCRVVRCSSPRMSRPHCATATACLPWDG